MELTIIVGNMGPVLYNFTVSHKDTSMENKQASYGTRNLRIRNVFIVQVPEGALGPVL